MATSLIHQANNTLAIWLAQLEKDAFIIANIRNHEIALMRETDSAIYDMHHKILKRHMGSIGSPSFGICQVLAAEMTSLAYETRICSFQWKQPFDDAVKNITHYKKELETCSDERRAATILKRSTEYYDTAKQCLKDAINAIELANSVASRFFSKVCTVDAEVRHRLSQLPTYGCQ